MAYADYDYYLNNYEGELSQDDFERLANRACAYLNALTLNAVKAAFKRGEYVTEIQDACCAVVDAHSVNEHGGGIASETNDGISVTYLASSATKKTDEERLYNAAALYLLPTGLLYRGCL